MPPENDAAYRKALRRALHLLARRDHSVWELRGKLEAKGVSVEAAQRVVAECLRAGYLNDERAACALIERFKHKGCGIRRIRFELRQRGLSGDPFTRLLASRLGPEEELGLARRALERKSKALAAGEGWPAQKSRFYRFLSGRGFTESSIRRLLDELDSVERQGPEPPAT
ncbi:MAG: recombination regulator RecX [Desulfobacterales bacterium]|jgi:regulatory protein|nr:recombination regulator RecX [Desulfobacterales bacterium]